MVYLHMKTTSKEIPISDIIATGHIPFFTDLSENSAEFKGQSNIDRFRLIYNGKVLKEEELTKITDNDSIRVILLPEPIIKKPIEDASKVSVDKEIHILTAPFRLREDTRLGPFADSFDLPDHVSNILKAHPQLVFDSHFLVAMSDWFMFRSYCTRNVYKGDATRNMFKYQNPEFLKIVKEIVFRLGGKFGYVFGQQRLAQRQAVAPAPAAAPPITQALLQNALQAALAGVSANPQARAPGPAAALAPAPAAAPAPVRPQPPPQPAEEPMQQGYEQQAAILREYGFENDDLIQLALEQCNGDVHAAMEFLIELQN
ncbi:hypothetical protein CAEBREN_14890 [Caenorhabditis brenneri]|uniref:UBA domain-containing protein n=1 Tax=Caenorhabditis brenneri TaxID=135651 RepID=G0NWY5_CAEBE|nr:hypothetical protein CAEBREN_14890 [Caenorhabditis brenneri]